LPNRVQLEVIVILRIQYQLTPTCAGIRCGAATADVLWRRSPAPLDKHWYFDITPIRVAAAPSDIDEHFALILAFSPPKSPRLSPRIGAVASRTNTGRIDA
jgi:hypothetical protein